MGQYLRLGTMVVALILLVGCSGEQKSLVVTATAYNSVAAQTDGQPNLAAWGDELQPGMKAVAVSRDLIDLGLTHGTKVSIEGLPGRYTVLDKTARRHTKRIDIYMGTDVEAAREWGKKELRISWRAAKQE